MERKLELELTQGLIQSSSRLALHKKSATSRLTGDGIQFQLIFIEFVDMVYYLVPFFDLLFSKTQRPTAQKERYGLAIFKDMVTNRQTMNSEDEND